MSDLLQSWVTQQAQRRPDATAVVFKNQRLTYAALEEKSNQLTRLLKASGCVRGDRVCVLMPKSPAAIVGILGILKADCVFVPLDPTSPAPRLAKMIESCDNRWILAAGPVALLLDSLFTIRGFAESHSVGWLGPDDGPSSVQAAFTLRDLAAYPADLPVSAGSPRDASHILFTSGSTGTPAGVVITHAGVRRFIDWAVSYFGIVPGDRISGHPPLHFDLSTFDIFGAFAAGAELHLIPPELSLLPQKLAELIRTSRLTQWFSVPSALNCMARADAVRERDFPELKRVLWCGEVLPTPTLIHWMRRVPHATFTNLYGPTETTIASSFHTVAACPSTGDEIIPIGHACPGETLLVLDEALRPVAPAEVGNLYIGGEGLSPGYWRDAERTARAFVSHAGNGGERIYRTGDLAMIGADGLVRFVGRADSQIKSLGYRVELGEVEAALRTLGLLHECAVISVAGPGFEGTSICCAYVALAGADARPAVLRDALARLLPSSMLPSRWMAFVALPINGNGKINRSKLRELFEPDLVTAG